MKVAVLGLGAMGARMAQAVLAAGNDVCVWNRSPGRAEPLVAAGARRAASPRAAAQGSDIVLSMVRDDEASREVWLSPESGALAGLSADAIGIECSTISPDWSEALAGAFARAARGFLDAPVVGSRAQAEAASLIVLAGGQAETLARAEPILAAFGGVVHHVGPSGAGARLKLVVNALLALQAAGMAELLSAARRLGLDAARAFEILAQTPPCSPAARAAGEAMLAGRFAPAFPIELAEKDLGYLAEAAPGLALTEAVRATFRRGLEAGLGELNITAVARLYP